MRRRSFLKSSVAALAGSFTGGCRSSDSYEGGIQGASDHVGHMLRSGSFPPPARNRTVPVLIVGGGIAGLSAAWKLKKSGFEDFELLELEPEVGGNARSGRNRVSAYPWGAHYVPLPTPESKAVRELFEDLGVIEGHTDSGDPIYREQYLCFAPQERLFIHGKWQEGIVPQLAATAAEQSQIERFHEMMAEFRIRRGSDSRKAFAIPMELSSRDSDLLALDRLSIREYLLRNGLDARPLHWYVNYACRDDFGTDYSDASAWAGIHYFASRDAESEKEAGSVLTWPEGNGWIVAQLKKRLIGHIVTDALVYQVRPERGNVQVLVYSPSEKTSTAIRAEQVILACPRFLAPFLLSESRSGESSDLKEFTYAPWMVANLTLKEFPAESDGAPICWDNVIYDSASLGYVVATHQSLISRPRETVFTYYYAMSGGSPREQRARLHTLDWKDWAELILRDLSKPHPDIRRLVQRLDVYRWGHAMVRPRPGFIWSEARRRSAERQGRIFFAHSDLSGFSIFEEAQYRGVVAAEQVLEECGMRYSSSL